MSVFFDTIRHDLFGGKMTQGQVDGVNTLLKATEGEPIDDRAYLLATSAHETAYKMQPIHEVGPRTYFDKYEPNTPIGSRLGNTRKGDGYLFRGRGYVQVTGRENYQFASEKLGVDFIAHPDYALRPDLAAEILVRGMKEGWFTGKKLSDYAPGDYVQMRKIVNGTDRAELIAGYALRFEKALRFLPVEVAKRDIKPVEITPADLKPVSPHDTWWLSIINALMRWLGGK